MSKLETTQLIFQTVRQTVILHFNEPLAIIVMVKLMMMTRIAYGDNGPKYKSVDQSTR